MKQDMIVMDLGSERIPILRKVRSLGVYSEFPS